jgi:hypothetical protein
MIFLQGFIKFDHGISEKCVGQTFDGRKKERIIIRRRRRRRRRNGAKTKSLQMLFGRLNYIVAVSFIGGGNQRILRKPPTCRKSLTNFYHIMLYTSP